MTFESSRITEKFKYYFEHFPAEHFSALYLINTIPCGLANFVTDPIYQYWILPEKDSQCLKDNPENPKECEDWQGG